MNLRSPLRRVLARKPVIAWALYDWANSAFATTVMAGFFPIFYSAISQELSKDDAQFWFNITLAVSSVGIAVSAPLLGAVADHAGSKKRLLVFFVALGVLMTGGLAWVHTGQWVLGLLLYAMGTIGFLGANVFYDSMLVDVADESELDVVSALGYSAGYIGGGILFALNILMVQRPDWFGLHGQGAAVRAAFVTVAVWWAVFTVPLLCCVAQPRVRTVQRAAASPLRAAFGQLRTTWQKIRRFKVLLLFLAAYWIYIDGVNTVIKVAVFYADRVLGLEQSALVTALLVTQCVAFPAALAFGWLGQRIGPKPSILIGISVYLGVLVYAWRWLQSESGFFFLTATVGLVQGGVQSLSRSLYARLIPPLQAAEFFGFFNMVGKFGTFLGPMLIAFTPKLSGGTNERDGILSVALLFVLGGLLLSRVRVSEGVRAARALR